ncbi:MAG: HAMP domain-containing histidine kinase [Chloroflexi bacterium]|nr:HAMP domain-containing histidine kinase [Chloroflexota bacterium]
MADRLWVRLLLAFAVVLAVAVGTAALFANRVAKSEFHIYLDRISKRHNERVGLIVGRVHHGLGWSGVNTYTQQLAEAANFRIVVVDQQGVVRVDTDGKLAIETIVPSDEVQAVGDPFPVIDPDGFSLGKVYLTSFEGAFGAAFLADLDRSLIWGATFGALVALGISLLLARWIVDPIERLTIAAQKVERGDLSQRVAQMGGGEVARLMHAFNAMAEGLERGRETRHHLVADVAHELRTPLHNVLGYLEMLRDGVIEPTTPNIASVYDEASSLKRLVDDLQQLALAESGQLGLACQPVSPFSLLQKAVENARPALSDKSIEVALEIENDLPDVAVDEGRIDQVLRNLISNAINFTPVSGRITITARRLLGQDETVELAVTDTGPGIAESDLPHVFERFYRSDKSRARATGGAGLGLTIARQLVMAHRGTISVESKPGQGARFRFTLPVSRLQLRVSDSERS